MPPRRRRRWQSLPAVDPTRVGALSQALDLALAPTLAAHLRRRPPPRDVLTLIRLAAGCRETLAAAVSATRREPDFVRAAAESYLRQVVCFPGADPYRTLGVTPQTPRAEMRRHMRELVLWLHPDRNRNQWNAALMRRVLEAWRAVGDAAPAAPPAHSATTQEGVSDRPPALAGRSVRAGPGVAPRRSRRVPTYRPSWISRPLPERAARASAAGRRLWDLLRLALIAAGLVVPALGPCGLVGLQRLADEPSGRREAAREPGSAARFALAARPGAEARAAEETGCGVARCEV